MEDRVRELNLRVQEKSQQRAQLTQGPVMTPNKVIVDTGEVEMEDDDLPSPDGQSHFHINKPEDGGILVDPNSDSGLASGSFAKSSKTSASDSEPFC